MMWWLTFLNGGVVIIDASSLTHARSLAAAHGLGRVVHLAEGHFINPESAALIPDAFIARMLSAIEARRLLDRLETACDYQRNRHYPAFASNCALKAAVDASPRFS